mgnify:CR=1 FL=1
MLVYKTLSLILRPIYDRQNIAKMKKLIILFALSLLFTPIIAQINKSDSSVQVVSYWNKHDKQRYTITEESYQVKNATDTIKRQLFTYDVDVEVIDSTATSYTIKWLYRNFNVKHSWNPIMEKLLSVSNNLPVIIKTSEMGVFKEVVNWEDVRDYIGKGINVIKSEYKDVPSLYPVFEQIQNTFSTREAIENSAIQEIQQYYTFHGAKYKLNEEYPGSIKRPNVYGGEPFDAEINVYLDEINFNDDNVILRTSQAVNNKQLTDAAYGYVKKMAQNMGAPFNTKRIDFPLAVNNIDTASRIQASTGWVIFSIQTKEVSMDNLLQVDERSIEIQ